MQLLWRGVIVRVACVVCALGCMLALPAAAAAEEVSGTFGGPLVAAEGLVSGGGQAAAEEELARLSSPEAEAERELSRTEYAGYGREAAVALAERVFGIGKPRWRAPQSEGAGEITEYVGETMAQETLPDGGHALLESSVPLRSSAGSGALKPVSLSLSSGESGYEEANPLVPVVISKSPGGGVWFQNNLGVAPAQHEAPESAELVGDRVFYPGTARDTDFMLEPRPSGVDASWQLLSAAAGQDNALTFSLPAGASLRLSSSIAGAAEVSLEGRRLLLIMPATAIQADGLSLPVSYTVDGDTLSTHVDLSGSVAFPVEVDPVISGSYGGNSKYWAGWNQAGTADAYFEGGEGNPGILDGITANGPANSWAAWSIYAPGWAAKEGGVSRVDVTGLTHHCCSESDLEAGIAESSGSKPIWSYFPQYAGEAKPSPLLTGQDMEGWGASFCAQEATGVEPTFCNESYGGNYFHLSVFTWATEPYRQYDMIEATTVRFLDSSNIATSIATGPTTKGGYTNALAAGKWLGRASKTRVEYSALDKAFGVASMALQRWTGTAWETMTSNNYETEGGCSGVQCGTEPAREVNYSNLEGKLPNGEDIIRSVASDPSGIEASPSSQQKLMVDAEAPHSLTVTGVAVKNETTIDITEGAASSKLTLEATDGIGTTPSSGVAELALEVDNHQITGTWAGCSPGPCKASGTWTLNGAELGVGVHKLTVTATDHAGNIASKNYTLIVNAAAPVAMGPGSVNPESGDFAMEATDPGLEGGQGALVVSRHYDSRNVHEGAEGPLGLQWTLTLGSLASLEVMPEEGGVVVAGPEGLSFFSPKSGGGFESPPGDSSLTLTLHNSGSEYVLENKAKGTTTAFTLPSGASNWMPTISKGPVATDTITDTYRTVEVEGKKVVEPTEELAPHSKLACPPELAGMERGCRALLFSYATSTTATGENESEWGEYNGRLMKVSAVAWNSTAKAMQETPVVQYLYDNHGRLRAEWDPRISLALKTIYGYDSEEHVTAVTPPGREPWIMTYGSIPGDAMTGRLLKASRPSASTALWAGKLPSNTEVPLITGSAVVGNRMTTSDGKWSNSPIRYAYYWEDCNTSGGECARINGATNPNYTPTGSDTGHTLRAIVAATNSGGTVTAISAATATVTNSGLAMPGAAREPALGVTVEYNVPVSGGGAPYLLGSKEVEAWGQKDDAVEATAIFPAEHVQGWPATNYTGASVDYMDANARTVNTASANGGISTTEYNEEGSVIRSLSANNRATALKEANPAEAASKLDTQSKYSHESSRLTESTGPEHKVKLANGEEVSARNHVRYFYDEGAPEGEEYGLVTKTTDAALLANGEEKDVRTTVTQYGGQEGLGWQLRAPTSVITEPKGVDLTRATVYEKETGDVVETKTIRPPSYVSQFGLEGKSNGQFKNPTGVAINSSGDIWVSDKSNNRVQEFGPKGEYLRQFGLEGKENGQFKSPAGIAIDSKGNLWVADTINLRVQEFSPTGSYLSQFNVTGGLPVGVTFDKSGHLWMTTELYGLVKEYTTTGENLKTFGSEGSGNGQFKSPWGIAVDGAGHIWVGDGGNNRIQELSSTGEYITQYSVEKPRGLTFNSSGNLLIAMPAGIEEMSTAGALLAAFGDTEGTGDGEFKRATGIAIESSGSLEVTDTNNNRVQKIAANGVNKATATQTIYYSAAANSEHPECGGHAEWANLPCRAQPAEQPKTTGLPAIPITLIEYNMWEEPEKTTEAFGATTRTKTVTYEGTRPTSQAITAGADIALPTIIDKYSTSTGALTEQRTESEGKIQTISRVYTRLGGLETYTDADGNTTKYGIDQYGRTTEINYDTTKLDGLEAKAHLSYDSTTGALSLLEDSAAGKFKPSYDLEGNVTSVTYPNSMTATYGYNNIEEATSLTYEKTNHCTGGECTWFKDNLTPSIHGEMLTQENSLANDHYTFTPGIDRLTEVQETPAGEGCTTRLYAYDAESNRISQTTRKPGLEGKCLTAGGETLNHTYDEANRLTDSGIHYDALDNVTKLPATDAGGTELLSEFYADSQLRTQTQGEKANTYLLDPEERTRQTETTTNGLEVTTTISHYAGTGSVPSWTYNQNTATWTRSIIGIGGLIATQEAGKQAILELRDLQGDIIGTASLNETESKPLTMERTTEFGIPANSKPVDKYGWLGALGINSEQSSGAIAQDGATYIPQLGAPLQAATTSEPAVPNIVTPFVITVPPWVPANYVEARGKATKGGAPEGIIPEPDEAEAEGAGGTMEYGFVLNKEIMPCYAEAFEPTQQETVFGHPTDGYVNFKCSSQVEDTHIQVCILWKDKGKWKNATCNGPRGKGIIFPKGLSFYEGVASFDCTVGRKYWTWGWIGAAGFFGVTDRSLAATCEPNEAESTAG